MKKTTLFLCAVILFAGCEKKFDNIIEPQGVNYSLNAPVVPGSVDYSVSPVVIPTIRITNLPQNSEVWFDVVYLFTDDVLNSKILMKDDGQTATSGDASANDNIFSGKYTFSNTAVSGNYEISFYIKTIAPGGDETITRVAFNTINFKGAQANQPPVISNLSLPATADANTEFTITIKASDINGLSDISNVWFIVKAPNGDSYNTNRYLYDDGALNNIIDEYTGNSIKSGDASAGDGIYTRKISFNSSAATGDWTFIFQAKDKSNALSNTISQKMNLK